jgi:hypothetical protein
VAGEENSVVVQNHIPAANKLAGNGANNTRRSCTPTRSTTQKAAMNNALHFVGFKDDRVFSALRVFGRPDFWHRIWDQRAVKEIMEGDKVVFASGDETQLVREFTHDDSAMF